MLARKKLDFYGIWLSSAVSQTSAANSEKKNLGSFVYLCQVTPWTTSFIKLPFWDDLSRNILQNMSGSTKTTRIVTRNCHRAAVPCKQSQRGDSWASVSLRACSGENPRRWVRGRNPAKEAALQRYGSRQGGPLSDAMRDFGKWLVL